MKLLNRSIRRLLIWTVWLVVLLCPLAEAAPAVQTFAEVIRSGSEVSSPVLTKSRKKKKKSGSQSGQGSSSTGSENKNSSSSAEKETKVQVEEDGTYTSKEEVAAYIHEFGHLPDNYITKNQAKKLGWVSTAGNLDEVAPGKSIGGDYFGNYEEVLPVKKGVEYHECDIGYTGGRRNSKRIIYSSDGYIYYTEDHYNTFEQLYPEE